MAAFQKVCILAISMFFALCGSSGATGIDVTTFHYDNSRSGWNPHETQLRPDTVSLATFGKLWYTVLDGQVYAAPLLMNDLSINGIRHEVVFAATENNSIYALDAETGTLLWRNHFKPGVDQETFDRVLYGGSNIALGYSCRDIQPMHGITGTPVIDPVTHTIYVCGLVLDAKKAQVYQVYAIDLETGKFKEGWPITIEGKDRTLTFDATHQTQRGALTLLNGTLYIPFSARCDVGEWHGWLVGISTGDPHAPQQFFSPSLTAAGGGIWGSSGTSVDDENHMYIVTGNGEFNPDHDNFGDSILRLTPAEGRISFSKSTTDYFTPDNYAYLDAHDLDLGGSSALVLPDHLGSQTPHLLLTGGKDGTLFLVNRDNLGGVGGRLQSILFQTEMYHTPTAGVQYGSLINSTPAAFVDDANIVHLYVSLIPPGGENADYLENNVHGLVAFHLTVDPATQTSRLAMDWTNRGAFDFPGTPVVSSQGDRDGIVWVADSKYGGYRPGVLCAYDALSGEELFCSDQMGPWDNLGEGRKFAAPTVANGRVFMAGGQPAPFMTVGVAAYGLLEG